MNKFMSKMEETRYIIELADHIPIRNVNFYLDTYNVMRAIDLKEMWSSGEMRAELEELEDVISGDISPEAVIQSTIGYLTCSNRMDCFRGVEMLGHVVLKHVLQREESSGEQDGASKLPVIFTVYSIVQDLIFNDHGPNYSFVGEVLQSLPQYIVTEPDFSGSAIKEICSRYKHEDIAAIFLGYSLVINRAPRPLIPFPRNPVGFPAFVLFGSKMLFPRILQVIGLSR